VVELGVTNIHGTLWPEPITAMAITAENHIETQTIFVFGLSPRLSFDDGYRDFLRQAREQLVRAEHGIGALAIRARAERANHDRDRLLGDLERANRAKDEFMAMLGHELRNPLAPIVTALKLIQMKPEGDATKELTVIDRQVAHLTRLIDDLLDVSRITRGTVELKKDLVDVSTILAHAVELASTLLEKRGHHLTVDVTPGLKWLGDPTRLAQVVANLLTNSARYTNAGGNIHLHAARDKDNIVIRVEDNGIGIAPALLPRIFDVFVQGQQSPDRAEGGLGIGLALVKNLVEMHSGSVEAHSEGVGRGSRFVIRLPAPKARRPSYTALKPIVPKVETQHPTQRVMIVDDNEDSADMLSQMLTMNGHVTIVAHDPIQALSIAPNFKPDVAVLDIGLPGMDGYELARLLRLKPELEHTRLIAVTGYGQDHDRAQSRLAGFEQHLVKPVDIETLTRVIADGTRSA
jgi:signal transduction histidine kinase/ActR/RegA family two-component response regulator